MRFFILLLFCAACIGLATAQNSPYDEALSRIRANESRRNTSLSLAGLNLTELPPEIGRLIHLETLYLNHNDLLSLPAEIGNLENLQNLYLSRNQLQSLPPEIGMLDNLRELDLSYNQLRRLPAAIGDLENLDALHLSNNQLESLPPEMGDLAALRWLDVSNNHLSGLPPEMGRLNLNRILVAGNYPPLGDIANLDTKLILTYAQANIIWQFWPLLLLVIGIVICLGVYQYRRRKNTKRRRIKNRA